MYVQSPASLSLRRPSASPVEPGGGTHIGDWDVLCGADTQTSTRAFRWVRLRLDRRARRRSGSWDRSSRGRRSVRPRHRMRGLRASCSPTSSRRTVRNGGPLPGMIARRSTPWRERPPTEDPCRFRSVANSGYRRCGRIERVLRRPDRRGCRDTRWRPALAPETAGRFSSARPRSPTQPLDHHRRVTLNP
jgi:hypothetical protein